MRLRSIIHHLLGRKNQTPVNTTPQKNISIPLYMGRWYEQARFENWFESDMDLVYTDYVLTPEGRVTIINTGTKKNGERTRAKGKGTICGDGKLCVSFVPPYSWFKAPYHILYVDPAYESALISGADSSYLWLLTRQPTPGEELLRSLLKEAELRGFNTAHLRFTKQAD